MSTADAFPAAAEALARAVAARGSRTVGPEAGVSHATASAIARGRPVNARTMATVCAWYARGCTAGPAPEQAVLQPVQFATLAERNAAIRRVYAFGLVTEQQLADAYGLSRQRINTILHDESDTGHHRSAA